MKLTKDSLLLPIIQKNIPKDFPVFYMNSEQSPDPNWIQNRNMIFFRQTMAKMLYVMSRTKDRSEIRRLFKGNLRGEGTGELLRESDVLKEENIKESNVEFQGEGKVI